MRLLHAREVVVRDDDEVDGGAAVHVLGLLTTSRACTRTHAAEEERCGPLLPSPRLKQVSLAAATETRGGVDYIFPPLVDSPARTLKASQIPGDARLQTTRPEGSAAR